MSKGGGVRYHYPDQGYSGSATVSTHTHYRPLVEHSLDELRSGASIIAEARATAWRWTIRTGVLVVCLAAALGWWLT